jgi:hypothetical protein
MIKRIGSIVFLGLCSASALAAGPGYQPGFHPEQLKGPPAGRPNEVLVLGSPHLSALPDTFAPAQLEPLLARLVAWKPQAIAVEAVSGLQCDFMRRYRPGPACNRPGRTGRKRRSRAAAGNLAGHAERGAAATAGRRVAGCR